jgi:NADH-quinone oxidoreductase subunit E
MRHMAQKLADTEQLLEEGESERRGGGAPSDKSRLIQVLLKIQREKHWLSEDDLQRVSQELDVPLTQIYHIATFYKAFSLVPKGRHSISVCLGTACQVRNAPRLLDRVVQTFKVRPGATSADFKFSLETVNCLGCCALGPVMMMDGVYYSKPSQEELEQLAAAE